MTDLHETIATLLLRGALIILFGMIFWAAAVIGIGLVTAAGRSVVHAPALIWADENAALLGLFLTASGYAWLKLRPATKS